ncbi:hypothetical protein M3Y94_01223500 [Aphelenchoides besseyi]|nr:hypothetical protein M3Y94_01223500 [Aphelenchoides besseyi]
MALNWKVAMILCILIVSLFPFISSSPINTTKVSRGQAKWRRDNKNLEFENGAVVMAIIVLCVMLGGIAVYLTWLGFNHKISDATYGFLLPETVHALEEVERERRKKRRKNKRKTSEQRQSFDFGQNLWTTHGRRT